MTELEKIFDNLNWKRKFENVIPNQNIVKVFRKGHIDRTEKYFNNHQEETNKHYRSAYLFTDSLSQAIAITEDEWEDE